jgi:hypothetical protein
MSLHIDPPGLEFQAGFILGRELLAASRPALCQKTAAADGCHAMTKAMPTFANQSAWLEGAFHPSTSIKLLSELNAPAGPKTSALYTVSIAVSQRRQITCVALIITRYLP